MHRFSPFALFALGVLCALTALTALTALLTGWLTRRPDRFTDDDRAGRDALLARSGAKGHRHFGRLLRAWSVISMP
jgi:hypothetical protein